MNDALELPTLAELRGKAKADAEARAREGATIAVWDAAVFYAERRTRAYIERAENRAKIWFDRRPEAEQEMILHGAVRALYRFLSPRGLAYRAGVSVRPGDLSSNVHLGDVLHLVSQYPRLWRPITLEGVASGALLFENCGSFAVVFANPNWRRNFTSSREDRTGDIPACLKVMAEPYPETLPDPAWRTGTRVHATF